MSRAVLSLGSNVGDRAATLQAALRRLGATSGVHVRALSRVYETAPVGGPAQPDFLNAVLLAETTLGVRELLAATQTVEHELGREPASQRTRWGPRSIDIDLVDVDGLVRRDGDLVLPHPRAAERAFVLVPWVDVDTGAWLPGAGRVADVLSGLDASGVRRRDDVALELPAQAR